MILAASVAGNAHAQFWKKKSKRHKHKKEQTENAVAVNDAEPETKEQKKKQKQDRKKKKHEEKTKKKQTKKTKSTKKETAKKDVPLNAAPQAVEVTKLDKEHPRQQKKNRYRVDVLALLYLDDLVKGGATTFKDKIPDKALPGVAFYAGLTIAADSLKKEGFNIDIYVHDVASFLESPVRLTTLGGIDSSDLIIGAVPPADIPVLAEYAKKNSVNFVSTMSASDGGVKDNPYFTMMQPSLRSHSEWIINDILKNFPKQQVSLLYRTKGEGNENAYDYLTDAPGAEHIHFKYMSCNAMLKKANFDLVVDPGKINVMIVSILDIGFADSLLHELSRDFPGTHFEVYGMPSWTSMPREGGMPNLTINVTTPFTIDVNTATGQYVKHMYHQNYSGKMSESVYRGYETMFWYATLLRKYGTHFAEKYNDNTIAAPFTQFDIKPVTDKKGHILYYENRHIFMSTYEGGGNKAR